MGPSAPLGTQGTPHGPGHPSEPNTPLVAQDPFSLCCAPHSAPWPRAHLELLLRGVYPTAAWCSCLQNPPPPLPQSNPLIKTKRQNLCSSFSSCLFWTLVPGDLDRPLHCCLSGSWSQVHGGRLATPSLRRPVIFHLWLYRRWDSQEHDADGARDQLQVRETWPRREQCAGCWPSLGVSFTILPPSLRPGPAGQGPLPSVRCLFSVLSSWLPKPDPLTI